MLTSWQEAGGRVKLAHIIGRPGHDITHALAVVESLAFAQQADVQFFACIPFHALTERFHGKRVGNVQQTARKDKSQDRQGNCDQTPRIRRRF